MGTRGNWIMVFDPSLPPAVDNSPAAIAAAMYRLLSIRGAGLIEHSRRTGRLARSLGEKCGLGPAQLAELQLAGDMHDVGKIDIPDAILLKPARLDAEEWVQMQGHSAMGEHRLIAMGMDAAHPIVSAVRHHHESFDGSGYPDGLSDEAIPLYARIVSIADSYDAIASARSYHRARSHNEILDIMGQQAHHYDPALLQTFFELMHGGDSAAPSTATGERLS